MLDFSSCRLAKYETIQVDWSLYGGAESTCPPPGLGQSKSTATTTQTSSSSQLRSRTTPSHLSMQKSLSAASSSSSSSCTASASSSGWVSEQDHDADADASSTSFTSEDVSDDQYSNDDIAKKVETSVSTPDKTFSRDGKPWLPNIEPVAQHDPTDFLWQHTEEPHRSRRMAILRAHPEVRTLMGYEPLTRYVSVAVLLLQLSLAVFVSWAGWSPLCFKFLALAYVVGGTANQNIFLAIHEITHNLAFKSIAANKALAIFVNAAIGVPYAMAFKPYHLEHHKYLGEDGVDTDLPTRFELICLRNNVLGKTFFATFQIFFYALRPGFVRTQKPTIWHGINVAWVIVVDVLLVKTFGWSSLLYLLFSSFFAGSLHPCAAHFIAEHYSFLGIHQETWSYYGPLNKLAYNVGYHNEHHDFPSIPWTRLPKLKAMAPEFYDILPNHTSWPMVTVRFILGNDSGLWARIKRQNRSAKPKTMQDTPISSKSD